MTRPNFRIEICWAEHNRERLEAFSFYVLRWGETFIGPLLIIGGKEDKRTTPDVLLTLTDLVREVERPKRIGVVTTASTMGEDAYATYQHAFSALGVHDVVPFLISSRLQAQSHEWSTRLERCAAVFFVGGDQLRITSLLGGTAFHQALRGQWDKGLIIAGTSAGASMMSSTMIVEGFAQAPPSRAVVRMAAGMGLWDNVVIDQHFTQRGRIGRLLAAVAQNPAVLGVGIDEDTALLVDLNTQNMTVYGSQNVTILDGRFVEETNVQESGPTQALTLTHVRLHVLAQGYGLHLSSRQPFAHRAGHLQEEERGED